MHLQVEGLVVGAERVGLPVDVRQDARADDRGAVLGAVALGPVAVAVEAVAELAGALVHQEAVLAQPALAVRGVERVEIEVPAERVERDAGGGRLEAVDRPAEVRERAEDVMELAVRPVQLHVQHGQLTLEVREPQLPDRLLGRRVEAVVRQHPLPGLERPVGAVGRLAAGDEPLQVGAVVRAAGVLEGLPDVALVGAVAAGVVELELDLLAGRGRVERVDRAPGEHVPALAARVEADQRLAVLRHLQGDVVGVPVDDLRGRGGGGHCDGDGERE